MTQELKKAVCGVCGEPMPEGEQMFNYHGYSGPCPKPPLAKKQTTIDQLKNEAKNEVFTNVALEHRGYIEHDEVVKLVHRYTDRAYQAGRESMEPQSELPEDFQE